MIRRFAVTFAMMLAIGSAAQAAIIRVDRTATGAETGTSWDDAYSDLQSALAAASSGDQIWVAAGAYRPDEGPTQAQGNRQATFSLADGVELYGGFPTGGGDGTFDARNSNPLANGTVLSGDLLGNDNESQFPSGSAFLDNCYHVVSLGWSGADSDFCTESTAPTAVLDGFSISGGNANGSAVLCAHIGGGVVVISGTIVLQNCLFETNYASTGGGGLYDAAGDSSSILNSYFYLNQSGGNGAGAFFGAGSHILGDTEFVSNSTLGRGGGVFFNSPNPADVLDTNACEFLDNMAYDGGAVAVEGSGKLLAKRVECEGNAASNQGGAIYVSGSAKYLIVNSWLRSNTSAADGGGFFEATSETNYAEIANSLVVANSSVRGGGMHLSNSKVVNCTVAFNNSTGNGAHGGGIGGNSIIRNSIVWFNMCNDCGSVPSNSNAEYDDPASPTPSYSCVRGTGSAAPNSPDANHNINSDPVFLDPAGLDGIIGTMDDNFRLQAASPCADAGNNPWLVLADLTCMTIGLGNHYRVADDAQRPDVGNGSTPCFRPPGGGNPVVDMGAYESSSTPAPEGIVYVNESAAGTDSGESWGNAFQHL